MVTAANGNYTGPARRRNKGTRPRKADDFDPLTRRTLRANLYRAASGSLWAEVTEFCGNDVSPDNVVDLFTDMAAKEGAQHQDTRWSKTLNKALQDTRRDLERQQRQLQAAQRPKRQAWPPKWMTDNRGIMDNLARQGNRYLLTVYEGLYENGRWQVAEVQAAMRWGKGFPAKAQRGEGKEYWPILATVPFEAIRRRIREGFETHVSDATIRANVYALAAGGLIANTGKRSGQRGPRIWMMGWWAQSPRQQYPNRQLFVQNSPAVRDALRTITVHPR